MKMRIKAFDILESPNRISSIDIFRAFAILPVVIFHFHGYLPYGYLGVDLFFVISGFLVGSILIKKFKNGERISFFKFFLQRGFKIWPSYYSFLVIGTLAAILFYRNFHPEFIINWQEKRDILRYLLFYQNYTGMPFHLTFDHVWSLCVEEHFYILLPLMFILIKRVFGNSKKMLLTTVIGLIAAGILFKLASILFTHSKDTYAGTLVRIDALGWGVLLGIIISYSGEKIKNAPWRKYLFLIGIVLLMVNIFFFVSLENNYFKKIVFHSLSPFSFFLMITGVYYYDFSKWKFLRFISYYSYNWYLWHPLFVWAVGRWVGVSFTGLLVYLVISFATAMIFTVLVEESFLKMRGPVLNRIFKPEVRVAV